MKFIRGRGVEIEKAHLRRAISDWYDVYTSGDGLDIGYKGTDYICGVPIIPNAIGVDLDFPGYDGKTLPFPEKSKDFVYAGHVLEHVLEPVQAIKEWYRVIRAGGFLILVVPHQHRYAKRLGEQQDPWCPDHKRLFTPGKLISKIEEALPVNGYRIVYCCDFTEPYDWSRGPEKEPRYLSDAFDVECVIEKRDPPAWNCL